MEVPIISLAIFCCNLDAMISAKDGIGLSPTKDEYMYTLGTPPQNPVPVSKNLFILYEGNLNLTLIKSLTMFWQSPKVYIPGTLL